MPQAPVSFLFGFACWGKKPKKETQQATLLFSYRHTDRAVKKKRKRKDSSLIVILSLSLFFRITIEGVAGKKEKEEERQR